MIALSVNIWIILPLYPPLINKYFLKKLFKHDKNKNIFSKLLFIINAEYLNFYYFLKNFLNLLIFKLKKCFLINFVCFYYLVEILKIKC